MTSYVGIYKLLIYTNRKMDHHEDECRVGAENHGKQDEEVRLVYLVLEIDSR